MRQDTHFFMPRQHSWDCFKLGSPPFMHYQISKSHSQVREKKLYEKMCWCGSFSHFSFSLHSSDAGHRRLTLVTLDKIRTIELGNALLHLLSTISIFFHTFFHTMYDVSSLFSKDAWCIMLGWFFKHRRSLWRNVLTSKIRYLSFFFNKNSALV